MSKMIQVRNVPDALHKTLKVRAAEAGLSLSDYIKRELEESASRPSFEEVAARVRARRRADGPSMEQIVEAVRSARDA